MREISKFTKITKRIEESVKELKSINEDINKLRSVFKNQHKEKEFNLKQKIEKIFVYESLLDNYFQKGDRRRGDVLVILGVIHAKVSKLNEEFIKELKKEFYGVINFPHDGNGLKAREIINKLSGYKENEK